MDRQSRGEADPGKIGGAGSATPAGPPATAPPPAGRWETPTTPRYHGEPFNEQYERWVRTSTGGPPDREYLVEHGGERAWFDGTAIELRGGKPSEVLIDAKGRYKQFVDPETGAFKTWWGRSNTGGLPVMMAIARRQVRVADGRPVEWWVAEPEAARAFGRAILGIRELRGRVRAVYKPMPDQ